MNAHTDIAPVAGDSVAAGGTRERFMAFVSDEASERAVREAIAGLSLSLSTVYRGDIGTAISKLATTRSPKALLVDISGAEPAASKVHHLAEVCEPGVSVVVIGERNDVGLYRDLLDLGISDYLVKPLPPAILQKAVAKLLGLVSGSGPTPLNQKLGKVVTVLGARGGIGASTVASNLAWALAHKEHRRVALVDLDLKFSSCGLILGVKNGGGLREALEQPERIDDLFLERALVRSGERLYLLACQENFDQPIAVDEFALMQLVSMLRREFHFVVLDAPRSSGTLLSQALEIASTRIIVLDQTTQALRDALAMRKLFDPPHEGQRNLFVLNRHGESPKAGISAQDIEATLGVAIGATIPFDPRSVIAYVNAGLPLLGLHSPVAKALTVLAEEVGGRLPTPKKPWWKFWG